MRCDKCRKKFHDDWVATETCPKYEITEKTGVGDYAPINLCSDCTQLYLAWLALKPKEADRKFGDSNG